MKIPKNLAKVADLYYQTREARLAAQKQVDAMKKDEQELRDHLINNIPKSDATGIAGKIARITVVTKDKPVIEDWDAFYKHIKKTGQFELLQRRVSEGAVKERWEEEKEVPGVGHFHYVDLSVSKVG